MRNDALLRVACLLLASHGAAALADDERPGVEFSDRSVVDFSGQPTAPKPVAPDIGLLIEGDVDARRRLGQLIMGGEPGDRILYEDDHHRVVGNPARPILRMMYRYDPASTDWRYDGGVVRGHVPRGTNFGWSVAVLKPFMAVLDWSAKPTVAAIVVYEKTPNSVRGWKKRYEVTADNAEQANCMGGLDAEKWLAQWQKNRGVDCGVRTLDGSSATRSAIQKSRRN